MRVAIVSGGGYVFGKEIVSLELADGLRDSGYSVEVVATLWTNGEFPRRLRSLGLPYTQIRLGYISATPRFNEMRMTAHQLIYIPSLWFNYLKRLRMFVPKKIIHTNWHHLLLLFPFLRTGRDIYWLHEVIPNKPQYRCLFIKLSARLDCFVCVSHAVAKSIIALGVPDKKVRVIHNGLSDAKLLSIRNRGGDRVRIGIVGQIGPWKGHDDLVIAIAKLKNDQPNYELHIFGSDKGQGATELRALVGKLEISDRLHWHGFVADRWEIYSKIDICAVPSRSQDPLPTVAIEAGMAGLPCVATRQGGLPEIIEDKKTGFLVDRQNPDQLADALEKLIRDPELRITMGTAARELVRERFSRDRFVKEFADLLEKC